MKLNASDIDFQISNADSLLVAAKHRDGRLWRGEITKEQLPRYPFVRNLTSLGLLLYDVLQTRTKGSIADLQEEGGELSVAIAYASGYLCGDTTLRLALVFSRQISY